MGVWGRREQRKGLRRMTLNEAVSAVEIGREGALVCSSGRLDANL